VHSATALWHLDAGGGSRPLHHKPTFGRTLKIRIFPSSGFRERQLLPSPELSHQSLGEVVEQGLGALQVGGVEAFCEPVVDRGEQVARLGLLAVALPQPR
jgi:hypothetical protein